MCQSVCYLLQKCSLRAQEQTLTWFRQVPVKSPVYPSSQVSLVLHERCCVIAANEF